MNRPRGFGSVTDFGQQSLTTLMRGERYPLLKDLAAFAQLALLAYCDAPRSFGDWRRIQFDVPAGEKARLPGFTCHLWIRNGPSGSLAVLAFRGTSGVLDWIPNLRALTRLLTGWFLDDHYEQVRAVAAPALAALRTVATPPTTVVAVGHSLGGGLAQHLTYVEAEIGACVAFNPSPVTAWWAVSRMARTTATGKVIFRVYERGEILAALRLLVKVGYLFNPAAFEEARFVEIGLALTQTGNPMSRHAMAALAEALSSLAIEEGTPLTPGGRNGDQPAGAQSARVP